MWSRSLLLLLLGCGLTGCEPEWPYDETADAVAEVQAAQLAAEQQNKLLMLIFGANWCPDCRVFDKAMYDPDIAPVVSRHFEVVKVDVGNWDHNLGFVAEWDNPIAGGIPAIVVADADHNILYDTKAGEMSTARNRSQAEFVRFFERLAAYRDEA